MMSLNFKLIRIEFILSLLCITKFGLTQTNREAEYLLKRIRELNQSLQFPQAIELIHDNSKLINSCPSHELKVQIYTESGNTFIRNRSIDSSIVYFRKAINLIQEDSKIKIIPTCDAYISYANLSFEIKEIDSVFLYGKKALDLIGNDSLMECSRVATVYLLFGKSYIYKGNNTQALNSLERAYKIIKPKELTELTLSAKILHKLGEVISDPQQIEFAINRLELALSYAKQDYKKNLALVANICRTLASKHKYLKNYDDAMFYLEQGTEATRFSGDTLTNGGLAYSYSQLCEYYIDKKDFQKARYYADACNRLFILMKQDSSLAYGYLCYDYALVNFNTSSFSEAVKWSKRSVELLSQYGKYRNDEVAAALYWLGRTQLSNDELEEAHQSLLLDLEILQELYGEEFYENYKVNSELGRYYQFTFNRNPHDSLITIGRKYHLIAEENINKKILSYKNTVSLNKLLEDAAFVAENSMNFELKIAHNKKDNASCHKAFQLSEWMHSNILRASTQESKALRYTGIPWEELEKDSLLRAELISLENMKNGLLEKKKLSITDSTILSLNVNISSKKDDIQNQISYFEKNYPAYYKLKYEINTVGVEKIQSILHTDQTLIEYFTGDSFIIAFVINNENFDVIKIRKDFPLDEWVTNFRNGITQFYSSDDRSSENYTKSLRQYTEYAVKLYNKVFLPFEEKIKKDLIIIPGEGLGDLAFEALLSGSPRESYNFKTYPFLLKTHSFQYNYSASLFFDMNSDTKKYNYPLEFIGFAPFYENKLPYIDKGETEIALRNGTTPLLYSGEEIKSIVRKINGKNKLFFGVEASKKNFYSNCYQSKIIHLSTHGIAHNKKSEFSNIVLMDTSNNYLKGLLTVSDIYNIKINAELVVLSACETGLGQDKKGEGIISLARAFIYAGSRSILSSLWKVNDQSTMKLMDLFYEKLLSGESTAQALYLAKLNYLKQNPGLNAHPFYWSGFNIIGDRTIQN